MTGYYGQLQQAANKKKSGSIMNEQAIKGGNYNFSGTTGGTGAYDELVRASQKGGTGAYDELVRASQKGGNSFNGNVMRTSYGGNAGTKIVGAYVPENNGVPSTGGSGWKPPAVEERKEIPDDWDKKEIKIEDVEYNPTTTTYTGPTFEDLRTAEYNRMYQNWLNQANAEYQRAKEAAEAAALKKKGQANTRRVTMEKYVPETLRAMGLANNGLAADAILGLDANYTNYILQALAAEEEAKQNASYDLAERQMAADDQMSQWKLDTLDKQEDAWDTLLKLAAEGEVDESYLTNYGGYYGFDGEEMQSVYDIYKSVAEKKAKEEADAEADALRGDVFEFIENAITTGATWETVQTQMKQLGYTDAQIESSKAYYDSRRGQAGGAYITSSYSSILQAESDSQVQQIVNEAYMQSQRGYISGEDYQKIYDLGEAQAAYIRGAITKTEYESRRDAILFGTAAQGYSSQNQNSAAVEKTEEQKAVEIMSYGITENSVAIDPNIMTAAAMYNYLDVAEGKKQSDYIDRIFEVSKEWDSSRNGTFVNFNYGANANKNNIFVFYDGKWYKTSLTMKEVYARFGHILDSALIDGKIY